MPDNSEKADITIDCGNFRKYLTLLLELDVACFPREAWAKGTWTGLFVHRKLEVYGVVMHHRLVGYLAVAGPKPEVEILRIGVSPNARRQKLGTLLMVRLAQALSSEGFSTVFLEVRRDNRSACSFYSSNGFAECGNRKNYYRSQACDALIFKLDITEDSCRQF